jgi:hypothetical protein
MVMEVELRPKYDYDSGKIWVWDGSEFRPKYDYDSGRIWVWDGSEFKPKYSNDSDKIWEVENIPLPVLAGFFLVVLPSQETSQATRKSSADTKAKKLENANSMEEVAKIAARILANKSGDKFDQVLDKKLFFPLKKRFGGILGRVFGLTIFLAFFFGLYFSLIHGNLFEIAIPIIILFLWIRGLNNAALFLLFLFSVLALLRFIGI